MSNTAYVGRIATVLAPTLRAEGWERYKRLEFRRRNATGDAYSADTRPEYYEVGHALHTRLEPFRDTNPESWFGVWHTTAEVEPNDSELQTIGLPVLALLADDGPDEQFRVSLRTAEGMVDEYPAMGRIVDWARRRRPSS